MIKIIGCIVILIASSGFGYIAGSRFKYRVKELRLLMVSLQMLETEMTYTNTPLPEAFESVYLKSSTPINFIFKKVSQSLKNHTFSTVGEAFEKALLDCKDIMALSTEDIDILKSFGHTLGSSDIDGQIKSFKMVLKQLETQEAKAEEDRSKNEKMYKNLGFLAGIAVSVLLL
jgi:stage III sporulation protein AB